MIGPFKPALGGFRYVYVAIDKFSKWIEYKPLIATTAKKAVELFEDIVHRFGLPNSIITDLGTTLPAIIFGTSAKTGASLLNTFPLLILEPTARSNGRMA